MSRIAIVVSENMYKVKYCIGVYYNNREIGTLYQNRIIMLPLIIVVKVFIICLIYFSHEMF